MNNEHGIPMINQHAPSFKASTTKGFTKFPSDYRGNWVILFSHPGDFTPASTTEFMRFAHMQKTFREMNTELIGISTDTLQSHIAWISSIKNVEYDDMKKMNIEFPVIDDASREIAAQYGMIQGDQALRATFVIDPKGYIRAMQFYPASTARRIEEFKRIIESMQRSDHFDVATPENWHPGDDVLLPPPSNKPLADHRKSSDDESMRCYDWYICFIKDQSL